MVSYDLPNSRPLQPDAVHVVVGDFHYLLQAEHPRLVCWGQLIHGHRTQPPHKVHWKQLNSNTQWITYSQTEILYMMAKNDTHRLRFHLVWWNQWRSCKCKSSFSICREQKHSFIIKDRYRSWGCYYPGSFQEYLVLPVHSDHHTLRAGFSYRLLDVSHLSLVLTSHQVTCNTKHI